MFVQRPGGQQKQEPGVFPGQNRVSLGRLENHHGPGPSVNGFTILNVDLQPTGNHHYGRSLTNLVVRHRIPVRETDDNRSSFFCRSENLGFVGLDIEFNEIPGMHISSS